MTPGCRAGISSLGRVKGWSCVSEGFQALKREKTFGLTGHLGLTGLEEGLPLLDACRATLRKRSHFPHWSFCLCVMSSVIIVPPNLLLLTLSSFSTLFANFCSSNGSLNKCVSYSNMQFKKQALKSSVPLGAIMSWLRVIILPILL